MTPSVAVLKTMLNEKVEMLKQSERLSEEGRKDDSASIDAEWDGDTSLDTLVLSVDSFVRV